MLHTALHFQADFAVEMVKLTDAASGDQMPVAADHAAVVRNDGLLIDRTEFFKLQAGRFQLHKIPP